MEKEVLPTDVARELELIRAERASKQPYYKAKAEEIIHNYEQEFDNIHNLDTTDYAICCAAGTIGGILDAFFIGIPHPSREGVAGGYLDGKIRAWFNEHFPKVDMEILARSAKSKVSYDAQDNRNTIENVDGLSSYYHRLLSLGHDPFLGFIVGIFDILNGTMTTISKTGVFTSQEMPIYANRMATQLLEAINKQWLHLKSDVNTAMGLPVPLMALFNTLQFGNIGREGLTIAEIVQGMYYQGYDFQHYCAMSIPEILVDVIVRTAWWIRMKLNGYSMLKTIPMMTSHKRTPKLDTMLCLSHACFCTINTIKIGVTRNPCAINYPEWLHFSKLLVSEVRWQLVTKSTERSLFVSNRIMSHKKI